MADAPQSGSAVLRAFEQVSVCVVGDAMLDEYVMGEATRLSPESPIPVLNESARESRLGGAANVAAGLSALGARAALVARAGLDSEGDRLMSALSGVGVDHSPSLRSASVPTTTKTRYVSGHQQMLRVDRERPVPLSDSDEARVVESVMRWLATTSGLRALVLSDYGKGMVGPSLAASLIGAAREQGVPVVADPKGALDMFADVTVLKPNRLEAAAFLAENPAALSHNAHALALELRERSLAENVVITLGADGMCGVGTDLDGFISVPSCPVEVADVSGAGDTVTTVLALCIACGWPLAYAMELATTAAALVCGHAGTTVLSAPDLVLALSHRSSSSGGKYLASLAEAEWLGRSHRQAGRRIVLANGCFDILHAGHVDLLRRARLLGDVLVVAVNTDASVTRLKGTGRPINALADRVAVLSALEVVDYVIAFEDDTPLRVVEALRPAVIVKGGDYRADQVVGGDEAREWGGRVEIIPLTPGRSTTAILEAAPVRARPDRSGG